MPAPRVKQGVARPRVQPTEEISVAPIFLPNQHKTRSQTAQLYPIGTIIRKQFDDGKYYEGEVTKYDPPNKLYSIEYCDGDREEYTHDEVTTYRKKTQQYSRTLKVRPWHSTHLPWTAIVSPSRPRQIRIRIRSRSNQNIQPHPSPTAGRALRDISGMPT